MLTTKNYNNNSSIYAYSAKFHTLEVDDVIIGNLDLSTISSKLKYIVVDDRIAPNTTLIYSNLSIQDSINRQFYNIYLPISSEDTAFFKSNVDFNQSITVIGNIYNTELINNTTNISLLQQSVAIANNNITKITGLVNLQTLNLNSLSSSIDTVNTSLNTNYYTINNIDQQIANIYINIYNSYYTKPQCDLLFNDVYGTLNSTFLPIEQASAIYVTTTSLAYNNYTKTQSNAITNAISTSLNTLLNGVSVTDSNVNTNINTTNLKFNSTIIFKNQSTYNNVIAVQTFINQFL